MSVEVKKNLWPAIAANLRLANKSHVAIGFPGEAPKSQKPHKDREGRTHLTNVEVALKNELGSAPGVKPEQPKRPFMAETMRRHRVDLMDKAQYQLGMISRGETTTHRALSGLGKIGADRVQETIVASKSWALPNAPYTIAKKKSSTPLIDLAAMRQAVTYKVRMKGTRQ